MKWTQADFEEVSRRWLSGESLSFIARAMQRGRGAVAGKLHRHNVVRKRDKAPLVTVPRQRHKVPTYVSHAAVTLPRLKCLEEDAI